MAREVAVDIIARDKASRTFAAVADGADKATRHIGGLAHAFGGVAKAAVLAGGAAALGGVVAVLHTGIGEVKDFSAGQAQLAAGLKSTGNAAHTSVSGMENLASSIQSYSGQTDDSIVAAESLLLTFTKVRNEAGKNNDVFDQATKATADMAARMGGDASENAIRLGKALNDPVKGITALTKVGVSFTAQQKKDIAGLVAHGKTLEAQKIILRELNTEFGGSAKAFGNSLPGQIARSKRAFEDVSQSIVQSALPTITRLFTFIRDTAIPGLGHFAAQFKSGFSEGLGDSAVSKFGNFVYKVVQDVKAVWPTIQKVFVVVAKAVIVALKATVDFIRGKVIPAIQTAVQWVIAHWPQIAHVFEVVWQNIKPVVASFTQLMVTLWKSVLLPIVEWVKEHWPQIMKVAKIVFIAVAVAAKVLLVALKASFDTIAFTIRVLAKTFSWLYNNVWVPITAALITTGRTTFDGVKWAYDHVLHPAIVEIHRLLNSATSWVRDAVSTISGLFKGIGDGLQWAYDHTIKPVLDFIMQRIDDVKKAMDKINPLSGGFGLNTDLTGAVKKAAQDAFLKANPGQPLPPELRAMGGPVRAGHPYIVGERRPELFVPDQNGRIVPSITGMGAKTHIENLIVNLHTGEQIEADTALPMAMRAAMYAL